MSGTTRCGHRPSRSSPAVTWEAATAARDLPYDLRTAARMNRGITPKHAARCRSRSHSLQRPTIDTCSRRRRGGYGAGLRKSWRRTTAGRGAMTAGGGSGAIRSETNPERSLGSRWSRTQKRITVARKSPRSGGRLRRTRPPAQGHCNPSPSRLGPNSCPLHPRTLCRVPTPTHRPTRRHCLPTRPSRHTSLRVARSGTNRASRPRCHRHNRRVNPHGRDLAGRPFPVQPLRPELPARCRPSERRSGSMATHPLHACLSLSWTNWRRGSMRRRGMCQALGMRSTTTVKSDSGTPAGSRSSCWFCVH